MTETGPTPRTTSIVIAGPPAWRQYKERIEGPTRKQAAGMAAYAASLDADAEKRPDHPRAFEWQCEAYDIRERLIGYGLDPETGKAAKKRKH